MGMGVDAGCFAGYKSGIIRNCTSKGVDHAVLMVAAGSEAGVPYFTIKNSWGSKWGENGYVRIEQGKVWWGKLSMIYTN
jgi:C1A family cysteine protease